MIRVDFDVPTYQRARNGLAIVSARLMHLLPEDQEPAADHAKPAERVVINRVFNPERYRITQHAQETESSTDEDIRGEFIPLEILNDEPEESDSSEVEHDELSSTEISFRGQKGKSVTGVYAGSGYAHYRFSKKNGRSFFLRIGKHLIWGIELNAALRRSGAQQGQKISVTFMGKTPLKVLKEVKHNGQAEQEWVDTHRNSWDIQVVK